MQKSIHSAEYQHFLEELRGARERAEVTQAELAERLGEHQTFVSKVERGVRRLDVVELRRWLLALGSGLVDFSQAFDDRLARHSQPSTRRSR